MQRVRPNGWIDWSTAPVDLPPQADSKPHRTDRPPQDRFHRYRGFSLGAGDVRILGHTTLPPKTTMPERPLADGDEIGDPETVIASESAA